MKKLSVIFCLLLASLGLHAQMVNPYVDDKIFHFGFSLGINFMSYGVTDSQVALPIDPNHPEQGSEIFHARTSSVLPGFSVGFISDLRMTRHLNLRFLPTLSFGQTSISYTTESGRDIPGIYGSQAEVLSLPLALPLVVKWSAEREMNYRPYLLAGGGVSFDFAAQKERLIFQKTFDYFVTFGFGCDFYLEWFKFCPELRYQTGFNNVLMPADQRPELGQDKQFYTRAIERLRNQMITLTFNFE